MPIIAATIFMGLWQGANAAGFVFSLMTFVCSVAEYIKGHE